MILNQAVRKQYVKKYINNRELTLFIESPKVEKVEVILAISFEDINELQELMPEEYFENHGIRGEVQEELFYADITNIMEWMELSVEDFKEQIDVYDWQRYENWISNRNAKSA